MSLTTCGESEAILWQAYRRLLGSVVKPLSIGLAISALVTVLVPDGFFAEAFGGKDWLAMPAMAIIGFPMYVCSTASIPIAASLILKGVSPGAAFVFTDATGFLDCYDGSKECGMVCADGVYEKGTINGTKFIAEAKALGKRIK